MAYDELQPSPSAPEISGSGDTRRMRGSNHVGMRQFNERIVLQAIRHHGAIPKADLARMTHLSSQTVAIIVGRLLDDGLLIKQERVRGRIGQPSVPLSLNPKGAYSIGVQLGRRSLQLVVVDFCGTIVERLDHRHEYPDPDLVIPQIVQGLETLRQRLGNSWSRVVGIGLTAPLFLHQWADLLGGQAAQLLARWEHVDLLARVQAHMELPVDFAKDTTAACVAELLQGHGQTISSFLYIYAGTFIGGALVLAGHIMGGERGNAGAIGSLPVALGRSSKDTNLGPPPQLLQMASGWQLEQNLLRDGHDPLLLQSASIMDTAYTAYTTPWLEQSASALAMTITSSAALLDLDAVVLDGALAQPLMQALLARTQAGLSQYSYDGMHQPQLLMGQIGSAARALGGALLPLHSQFFPDKNIFLKRDKV
jgi:predicted NBD/HSP70 family sugar kinase